jgi:hypothetical protein
MSNKKTNYLTKSAEVKHTQIPHRKCVKILKNKGFLLLPNTIDDFQHVSSVMIPRHFGAAD